MSRLWSFDLDGVLAEPPLGWNPAINRDVSLEPDIGPDLPPSQPPDPLDRLLTATWYRVRYLLRPPRDGALEAVRSAKQSGSVIVLTGRHERGRPQTESWLNRHGFTEFVDAVVMNASALKSARYKEAYLRDRGATLHIDDDAATAALLARTGTSVALVDWPRNRGLAYPDGVTRCDDMSAVQELIERMASDG
jgi:FMN phosphatase YigB (HAD superfamily)